MSAERDGEPQLLAYLTLPQLRLPIVPAALRREWMDKTFDGFPNRCLPLLMSNQSGWFLLNTRPVTATWSGGPACEDTVIDCGCDDDAPAPVTSHFGGGIVTWIIPYLFRTPPGYNLAVRGPTNWPKDGATALDGLVETDWSMAPFTMNWKLTRPNHPVRFEVDDPICMVLPQRRGELESFDPQWRDIRSEPAIRAGVSRWHRSRMESLAHIQRVLAGWVPGMGLSKVPWQRHYFRGMSVDGEPAPEHQMKLNVREFHAESTPPAAPPSGLRS
jgi:hypothetical protein